MCKPELIHICHANIDNKNAGGAYIIERRVENEIRKYGYIFDYITMDEFVTTNNPDLDLLPGSVAHSAHLRGNRWLGHIKLPFYAYSVFKKCRYPIVHIDIDLAGKALLYAVPAKLSGSKVIVHSHSTGIDGDHRFLKGLAHKIGRQILPLFTNGYLACSQNAAKWMFPKRLWKDAVVLFNGTDLTRFRYSEELRRKKRLELDVQNQLVIGNIGTICWRKNQLFLVELLNALRKRGIDAVLLLVGVGPVEWEQKVHDAAKQYDLSDSVRLLGVRSDTNELLNAMDLYVCPSFIEGAPVTLYEAQATGLPCIMSDTVSEDTIATDWLETASLKADLDAWCVQMMDLHMRFQEKRAMCKMDDRYGLAHMAKELSDIYGSLLGRNAVNPSEVKNIRGGVTK